MADEQHNAETGADEKREQTKRASQLVERVIQSLEKQAGIAATSDISQSSDTATDVVPAETGENTPATPEITSSLVVHDGSEKQVFATDDPPWTLQQFFDGEIDLDIELSKRFPSVPLLSEIRFRNLGTRTGRRIATLNTGDQSATMIIEADTGTRAMQVSFTVGSMLTLRFSFTDLSDMDRDHWLELMQRREGGLAFLWGASRWAQDYIICITRPYFTNLYAFSPANFEAAVRLTPQVLEKLLAWLDTIWHETPVDEDDDAPLLTW